MSHSAWKQFGIRSHGQIVGSKCGQREGVNVKELTQVKELLFPHLHVVVLYVALLGCFIRFSALYRILDRQERSM